MSEYWFSNGNKANAADVLIILGGLYDSFYDPVRYHYSFCFPFDDRCFEIDPKYLKQKDKIYE